MYDDVRNALIGKNLEACAREADAKMPNPSLSEHVQRLHERQCFTETSVRDLQRQMEELSRFLGITLILPMENVKPEPLRFAA